MLTEPRTQHYRRWNFEYRATQRIQSVNVHANAGVIVGYCYAYIVSHLRRSPTRPSTQGGRSNYQISNARGRLTLATEFIWRLKLY